jgi:hypothetical protein
MKIFSIFIYLSLMLPLSANAGVMTYKYDRPGVFAGGFTYDDVTGIYSDVEITDTNSGFGEMWTSAVGDGLGFISTGINYGATLAFQFTPSLDGLLHQTTVAVHWIADSQLGQMEGDGSMSSVPSPATLALFGLGLAGLGLSRRKKA